MFKRFSRSDEGLGGVGEGAGGGGVDWGGREESAARIGEQSAMPRANAKSPGPPIIEAVALDSILKIV
jgi:hypothetical protein